MAKQKQGQKHRKYGRASRRPGNARRKNLRPDLDRKFKNVLRSCGKQFAAQWITEKFDRGEPVLKFRKRLKRP